MLVVVLCACSGVPQSQLSPVAPETSPPGPSPTAPPAATSKRAAPRHQDRRDEVPIRARVAVTALPTLPHALLREQAPYRVVDRDVHLDVAVPQVTGAAVLNKRLRAVADTWVGGFRQTLRKEASRGRGRYHAMTVGWQLLGKSTHTTGIQLWVAQQHGLRVTIDRATVWYDNSSKAVLTPSDLFTPRAWPSVQHSISRALPQNVHPGGYGPQAVRTALAARAAPEGKGPTFGFSADGDLVMTFAAHVLSAGVEPLFVRLPGDPLLSRLSAAGLSARSAARVHPVGRATPAHTDCAKRKCVALTFDDGPASFTAELVAVLQQRKVPATFFMVGNRIRQSSDLLAAVSLAGMEIGNHSTHHRQLTQLGAADMRRDLAATSQAIAAVTGRRPTLLRPPYGARNRAVDTVSRQLRMAEILWDVDTLDWRYADSARVRSAAVGSTRRGSIILLHDVNRTTVAAVPGIIGDLQRRGYSLVTVSQLLGDRTVPGKVYRRQAVAPHR